MQKRIVHRQPPDGGALREAMKAANNHLDYIDYLIDHRTWLAGATMSLADLAAAAHISVADYLGGLDWTGHDQIKGWYAGPKIGRASCRARVWQYVYTHVVVSTLKKTNKT